MRGIGREFRSRLALAVATAAASVAVVTGLVVAVGAPAVAGDDERLLPDLVTLRIESSHQLALSRYKNRTRLELDNTVGNKGEGPLQISASPNDGASAGGISCNEGDYIARQDVYSDTNGNDVFDRGGVDIPAEESDGEPVRDPFGCMNFHPKPGHMHWHVINFTIYELMSWNQQRVVAQVRKQGFCLLDGQQSFSGLPGSPDFSFFTGGECGFSPDEAPGIEGISIGYSDVYSRGLPGQAINITGVPAGRYCLSSKVDPLRNLAETDESNNTRLTPIQIQPKIEKVTRLPGRCPQA